MAFAHALETAREVSIPIHVMRNFRQKRPRTPDAQGPDRLRFRGVVAVEGAADGARTRDLQSHTLASDIFRENSGSWPVYDDRSSRATLPESGAGDECQIPCSSFFKLRE
jgi:hypothetical protein